MSTTADNKISLEVAEHIVQKLESWGYSKCYYHERDALPGRNIFDELFRVINGSQWTIVVLTREFVRDCWGKYRQQSAFKNLLDKDDSRRLLPVVVGLQEEEIPDNLNVLTVTYLEGKWRKNSTAWEKLKKALDGDAVTETQRHDILLPVSTQENSVWEDGDFVMIHGKNEKRVRNQSYQTLTPSYQTKRGVNVALSGKGILSSDDLQTKLSSPLSASSGKTPRPLFNQHTTGTRGRKVPKNYRNTRQLETGTRNKPYQGSKITDINEGSRVVKRQDVKLPNSHALSTTSSADLLQGANFSQASQSNTGETATELSERALYSMDTTETPQSVGRDRTEIIDGTRREEVPTSGCTDQEKHLGRQVDGIERDMSVMSMTDEEKYSIKYPPHKSRDLEEDAGKSLINRNKIDVVNWVVDGSETKQGTVTNVVKSVVIGPERNRTAGLRTESDNINLPEVSDVSVEVVTKDTDGIELTGQNAVEEKGEMHELMDQYIDLGGQIMKKMCSPFGHLLNKVEMPYL
ncbi:hypothetical protein ScPMuIL_006737 [Solemya velum]